MLGVPELRAMHTLDTHTLDGYTSAKSVTRTTAGWTKAGGGLRLMIPALSYADGKLLLDLRQMNIAQDYERALLVHRRSCYL